MPRKNEEDLLDAIAFIAEGITLIIKAYKKLRAGATKIKEYLEESAHNY